MSDFIPKSNAGKANGLGPKAQKLQALREKAAQKNSAGKTTSDPGAGAAKARTSFTGKKVSFQRKAV